LQEHFQVSSQSELPMAQFGQVMITLDLLEKSLGTGKAA
jgi:hypothetical protein